jgi:hypothetical protein
MSFFSLALETCREIYRQLLPTTPLSKDATKPKVPTPQISLNDLRASIGLIYSCQTTLTEVSSILPNIALLMPLDKLDNLARYKPISSIIRNKTVKLCRTPPPQNDSYLLRHDCVTPASSDPSPA